MDTPLLSVVIPIHNGASWIVETLTSICAQTYANFEILLVDDASTDNLASALNACSDARLQVLHLEKNLGVAGARNAGIAKAKGQYIAFCDADDICLPDRFERQLQFLQAHPQIGVCGTGFTCFDTQERETVLNPETSEAIRHALMRGNCFGMSTIMGRTELFKTHAFDQSLAPTEDYDMWTRLSASGVQMANLPLSLIRYRLHAMQASQQKSHRLDQLARKIRSVYCARLMGSDALVQRLQAEQLSINDLNHAADEIRRYCETDPAFAPAEFRFMLAWMYQKLAHHGVSDWQAWKHIQAQLGISLDRTYRINTALLAFLPSWLTRKHFDTLIKLKR